MNSQRRTGRAARTVYSVRFSISFETSPIPMKIAITIPNSEIAVSPRLISTMRLISSDIWPNSTEEPTISRANRIRL